MTIEMREDNRLHTPRPLLKASAIAVTTGREHRVSVLQPTVIHRGEPRRREHLMALSQEALVQGMHGFSASGFEAEFKYDCSSLMVTGCNGDSSLVDDRLIRVVGMVERAWKHDSDRPGATLSSSAWV